MHRVKNTLNTISSRANLKLSQMFSSTQLLSVCVCVLLVIVLCLCFNFMLYVHLLQTFFCFNSTAALDQNITLTRNASNAVIIYILYSSDIMNLFASSHAYILALLL